MKLSRYSASGITQNSGTAAMSVVRYVVTPSIRLEGTAARPIQRSRRRAVTSAGGRAAAAGRAGWGGGAGAATTRPRPRLRELRMAVLGGTLGAGGGGSAGAGTSPPPGRAATGGARQTAAAQLTVRPM